MRPCFAFSNINAADDKPAVLSIYDEIGFWGVQAKDFISQLGQVNGKSLQVEINSPGGDVYAGLAIYNALRGSGKEIVVKVMGVAASIASLIAMAGDKIVMPKNTFMMIHNPWTFAAGNADDLREVADTLDKIGGSLLATYSARTGLSAEELAPMLAKDTWLTADEALEKGFATEVVEGEKISASFDMARAELPDAVKAAFVAAKAEGNPEPEANEEETQIDSEPVEQSPLAEQIATMAARAEMADYTPLWAVTCTSLADVKAKIEHAREVKALCAVTKHDAEADTLIRAGKSLDEVRAHLAAKVASRDENVDSTIKNETQVTTTAAKPGVKPASIWASYHGQK